MAIKAYVGIMGSGKTYEVASVVIYDAIKSGRRVVSNIAGLNQAEYYRLLELEGYVVEKLGQIISVPHTQVLEPDFWMTDKDTELGITAFLQAGDLLVLDEIWRFWDGLGLKDADGKKRPERVMNFFRMHRQFVNVQTGATCDVALITQDVNDIHRQVKGVIEETYKMTKLTAVGLSNRYRVDVFMRTKTTKNALLRSFQRSYDSNYFNLYQSHSQKKAGSADAREINIDKRGNVLGSKLITIGLPICLLVAAFALYYVWGFLHPKPKENALIKDNELTASHPPAPTSLPSPTAQATTEVKSDWHVQGVFTKQDVKVVLLVNDNGSYRYLYNPILQVLGSDIQVMVDGVVVNNRFAKTTLHNGMPK